MLVFENVFEFQWDKGNIGKNKKHYVADTEIEQIFFDKGRVIFEDLKHTKIEKRFIILGKTKKGRLLYTVFTKRGKYVRAISARDINRKEVYLFEKTTEITKIQK